MIENEAYNQEHLLDLLKEMQNSQACIFDAKLREAQQKFIKKLEVKDFEFEQAVEKRDFEIIELKKSNENLKISWDKEQLEAQHSAELSQRNTVNNNFFFEYQAGPITLI